jgi:type IV secretory pathway VirB10-like protein
MAAPMPRTDPRPPPDDLAPTTEAPDRLRPDVAKRSGGASSWVITGGAVLAGAVVFLWLSNHRHQEATTDRAARTAPAVAAAAAQFSAPPPPPELLALEAAGRAPVNFPAPPPAPELQTAPPLPPAVSPSAVAGPPPIDRVAGRKSPALVVDLGESPAAATAAGQITGATGGGGAKPSLNDDEMFAARVGSASEPDRARATMLRNRSTTVPQGAIIPGVLETALNSDLPGFVRAVVSRDVRSFDGSMVLIPRGSRVIGQYKSGVALGQSRAFIIWSRILRPDGASIQISSSGADALGRAGMTGDVDRHFFQRFGGAILLSVLNAGSAALVDQPSAQVVIGTSQEASGLATALTPTAIPPTVKVPQGSPIRIFVARDLDFSTVGGVTE